MCYIKFNILQLTLSMNRGVRFTGGIKPAFSNSEDPTRCVDYLIIFIILMMCVDICSVW